MSLITDSKFLRLISSRLRNFKQKKDYLWNFSCPLCGDSKKNLSKARGYAFAKGVNLFYSCHNCGVGTNLANLKSQLEKMYDASCTQHSALSTEINALKSQRDKWVWIGATALAIVGWLVGHSEKLVKLLG